MKKYIKAFCIIGLAAISSFSLNAKEKTDGGSGISTSGGDKKPVNVAKAASCAPTSTITYLDFNDVSALLETGGSMFQNRAKQTAGYEVPKTINGNGPKAIYSGSLWMGGKDETGQLKIAALCFRNDGSDFWAGPLSVNYPDLPDVNYDPSDPVTDLTVRAYGGVTDITAAECQAWDKFFPMSKALVIRFSVWWEACSPNSPTANSSDCNDISSVPSNEELASIELWPAHGDYEGKQQDYYLAPFYDRNTNGSYEPDQGDYPWYDDILGRDDIECGVDRRVSLFGDNTIWWVFNDKGNIHGNSGGQPIGMEIRAQAFSFATADEINRMTFYNYEMINRSTQTLTNTFFSQYVDSDLGGSTDDYVGCDVSRGLGYAYNGDNLDETNQGIGYGDNPPAIGIDFFEGPYQDADGADNPGPVLDSATQTYVGPTVIQAVAQGGIVYKGIGVGYGDGIVDNERFGMRRFTYFTGNGASFPYADPTTANQYYNFMEGSWADGSEMWYGGNGGNVGPQLLPSDYMFPGDSDPLHWATGGVDPGFDWTEVSAGTQKGDRRFVQSAGPFTLKPGAMNNITVGIVYGRAFTGGLFASVDAMKRADTKAQALFDACFRIISPPDAPQLSIQELENELVLTLSNPPNSNNFKEQYKELDDINIPNTFADRDYVFEGYQIFQMVNGTASVADIEDNSKARLVAQCDIKNDVSRIINFEFDEELGFSSPVKKVDGANKGISHSFLINEDQFASGTRTLVNHKTYYYIAIAYGFNQFKQYDPTDPFKLDGQQKEYLSSRISADGSSIKAVAGVPHNPLPEADGTFSYIPYGSTPEITRLDGFGNGNRALELTSSSMQTIIATGKMEDPTYVQNGGPINVKVIDPLNVQGGYYELLFVDYGVNIVTRGADTAKWILNRYTSKGGTFIDSYSSERMIDNDNEQLIPEWGISVQIKQYTSTGSGLGSDRFIEPISSSYTFKDSSKRWLGFISDQNNFYPTNWIRSGTYDGTADANPSLPEYINPGNYNDEAGIDDGKLYTTLLSGGIAPHKLVGATPSYMPLKYHPNASAISIARSQAAIAFMPSIDIVITSDKTKWTRCPVVELGSNALLNVNAGKPGELRKSPSVNKEGANDGSGTTGMGWFPGYAVDLETGRRLHMAFGENSFLSADNGADMKWNPSSRVSDNSGNPVMGGCHAIWVFGADIKTIHGGFIGANMENMPEYIPSQETSNNFLEQQFNVLGNSASTTSQRNAASKAIYGNLCWIAQPLLAGQLLATDVTIKVRVNKEYKNYTTTGANGGKPMYSWNMDNLATSTRNPDALAEALQLINVVPNPYYAFSEYESSRLDARIKITNLPEKCTIKIYSTNGKLVRQFKKDSPVTSIDWDLNNIKGIQIASGVYLIHVDVPGTGERVLKFFAGMRQLDLQGI